MFSFIKSIFTQKESDVKASLQTVGDKTGLFVGGELLGTYARRRDAVRGAARRGFVVLNG
jgi:hypothetical protein